MANRPEAVAKLVKRLGPAFWVSACYEAGPCGYGVVRQLTEREYLEELEAEMLHPTEGAPPPDVDPVYLSACRRRAWIPASDRPDAVESHVRAEELAVRAVRPARRSVHGMEGVAQ